MGPLGRQSRRGGRHRRRQSAFRNGHGRRRGANGRGRDRRGRIPQDVLTGPSARQRSLALLAGGGNANADQHQDGRRRQADHQRHLGRRKASLILERRNNGLHVSPRTGLVPVSEPLRLVTSPLPDDAGTPPACAAPGLISGLRSDRAFQREDPGHWYQLFPYRARP